MRSAIVIGSVVLLLAGRAAAQPGMTAPNALPPASMQSGEELSDNVALMLSLGGTVGSWTLLFAAGESETMGTVGALGTLLAPSFGHWYARSVFTRGLGLRLLGAGVGAIGIGAILDDCGLFSEGECDGGAGPLLLLAGLGLYVGGTVDDIVTAPGKARRYNERFQNVAIVPVVRGNQGGVMLTGQF